MTASAIFSGTIRHRRVQPAKEFTHRLSLAYVDLDELPSLLGGRLLARGPGMLRFRRRDYLGPASLPLDVAVRDRVAELSGARPAGPIRLLTQLRSFGLCFNPVSFYYCFDGDGRVGAALAEVTSTPWGERHAYALARTGDGRVLGAGFDKRLHVSPFMAMDQHYELRMTEPGETLSVHIESFEGGRRAFDATLRLERVTRGRATSPLRVLGLIYGHALLLKLKGVRVHPRPEATA